MQTANLRALVFAMAQEENLLIKRSLVPVSGLAQPGL